MNVKNLRIVNVQDINDIGYDIAVLNNILLSTDLEKECISKALNDILIKLKEL